MKENALCRFQSGDTWMVVNGAFADDGVVSKAYGMAHPFPNQLLEWVEWTK